MIQTFKRALKTTVPVMAGYLVLGAGFGILMNANGFSLWWSLVMSVFIFAGSMQYVGVGLLVSAASPLSVALTTLMVNARHIFYGISMIDRYRDTGKAKPYLVFALSDETFSIVCHSERNTAFYLFVSLLDQCYWVVGTLLGALAGMILPFSTEGVDFVLTALFITVFMDQWLTGKDHFPAVIGLLLPILCLVIFGAANFLIPSMAAITVALLAKGFIKKEVGAHE